MNSATPDLVLDGDAPDFGQRCRQLVDAGAPFEVRLSKAAQEELAFHLVAGTLVKPAAAFLRPKLRPIAALWLLVREPPGALRFETSPLGLRILVKPPSQMARKRCDFPLTSFMQAIGDLHRRVLAEPADPIHAKCDVLLATSPSEVLSLERVNERLHSEAHWDPWPDHFVAFASNGGGDYFAYDLRVRPPSVFYVDPAETIATAAEAADLTFPSFDEWYQYKMR